MILKEYPSSSNPGKVYHVILGDDNVMYCDCMGWKMHRDCRHLRSYRQELSVQTKADRMIISKHKSTVQTIKQTDDEERIETAVNFINGR